MHLYGRFRLEDADGHDFAPRSAKSQALIALLATSETGGRGRLWLQKRLWPGKEADKASTSLRQALSEIRRNLSVHRDVLVADRRSVSLDLDKIEVIPAAAGALFLDGIQLTDGDHAVGDWLAHYRKTSNDTAGQTGDASPPDGKQVRRIVLFQTQSDADSDLGQIEGSFVSSVAKSIRETLTAEVRVQGVTADPNAFLVEIQAYHGEGDVLGLRARVRRGVPVTLVWSGMTSTRLRDAPPVDDVQIVALGNQLIDALAETMTARVRQTDDTTDINVLIRLAIRRMSSRGPEQLAEAERLLIRAETLGGGALTLALRAQLHVIQYVEKHDGLPDDVTDIARRLAEQAMEREPMNAMVVAAFANIRLVLDGDVNVCMELARRSVRLNPANPLTWNSLATAKLYAGDIKEAHDLAVRAQKMNSGAPFGHWWDFGQSLTAALTQPFADVSNSGGVAGKSQRFAPGGWPALQHLTGNYAPNDRFGAARPTAARLHKREPMQPEARNAPKPSGSILQWHWDGLLNSGKVKTLTR